MHTPTHVITVSQEFSGHPELRLNGSLTELVSYAPVDRFPDPDSGHDLVVGVDRVGFRYSIYADFVTDIRPFTDTASFRCGCVYVRAEAKCVERCERHEGRKP